MSLPIVVSSAMCIYVRKEGVSTFFIENKALEP